MQTKGIIFDIKRFALHDGPGLRTTVFLKGCPLSCGWCHNPESREFKPVLLFRPSRCISCLKCIEACPEYAVSAGKEHPDTDLLLCSACGRCVERCPAEAREIVGREYTIPKIMEEIRRDRIFHDESGGGATFSGGEPLAQPGFVVSLLRACRSEGIHTALDTSGFAEPRVFLEVASLADLVLFDLKVMDPEIHLKLTGVYNKEILENISELSALGKTEILIRIPLIPGLNDNKENISQAGAYIRGLPGIHRVELLPFNAMAKEKHLRFSLLYKGPDLDDYQEERADEAVRILRGMGLEVFRRNRN